MTKQEIIRNLKEYLKYSDAYSQWKDKEKEARAQIKRIKREEAPIKSITFKDFLSFVIISGIIACIVGTISYGVFVHIYPLSKSGYCFAIATVPFVVLLMKKQQEYDKENVEIINEHKIFISAMTIPEELEIEEARKNQAICKERRDTYAWVMPEKYRGPHMARKFLDYLSNGRADTMKEAINLYEVEERQERAYRETARHNQIMEEEAARQSANLAAARDEASRAADASEQAARNADFWGFVNSLQIDELNKK